MVVGWQTAGWLLVLVYGWTVRLLLGDVADGHWLPAVGWLQRFGLSVC